MFDPRYITSRRVRPIALILRKLGFAAFWPEAGELMGNVCTCSPRAQSQTLLQHPASPVRHVIANSFFRRAVMGLGMGATVVAIVTSTWGKQSAIRFGFGGRLEKAAKWL
jgi:hypothetical protein